MFAYELASITCGTLSKSFTTFLLLQLSRLTNREKLDVFPSHERWQWWALSRWHIDSWSREWSDLTLECFHQV